jgi:hypothetical protein
MNSRNYEEEAKGYIDEIKLNGRNSEKSRAMACLADTRLQQYLETGDLRAKRLAGNCYIASKIFLWKSLGINVSEIRDRK